MRKKLGFHPGSWVLCAAWLCLTWPCETLQAQSGSTSTTTPTSTAKTSASSAEERPLYYTREITPADLKGRTLRELSLMRNTIFARAGNKFRKKWLNDYFNAQLWYHPLDKMDEGKLTPVDHTNAVVISNYDAALTREQLVKEKTRLLKSGASGPEDKIELRLLSERLGTWSGDAEDRTPLGDPSMLDKQLTLDQLADLSRRDLRLLRNMVYARRGRAFTSDVLQQYFGSLDWYKSDPSYTDAKLTDVDRRNITLIRSVEEQLGGPLTDLEHKREDGWFANA